MRKPELIEIPCPFCALTSQNAIINNDNVAEVIMEKETSTVYMHKDHPESWKLPIYHIANWALHTLKLPVGSSFCPPPGDYELKIYRRDKKTFCIMFITIDKNASCHCSRK